MPCLVSVAVSKGINRDSDLVLKFGTASSPEVCTILVHMVENKIAPVVLCIFFASRGHEYFTFNQFVEEVPIKYLLKGCISMLNDINCWENEILCTLQNSTGSCHCPMSRGSLEVYPHSAPGHNKEEHAKASMNIFSYRCKSPLMGFHPKINGESRPQEKKKKRLSREIQLFFLMHKAEIVRF